MGGLSNKYKGLSGVEPTISSIGGVAKSGDTMTGNLQFGTGLGIHASGSGGFVLEDSSGNDVITVGAGGATLSFNQLGQGFVRTSSSGAVSVVSLPFVYALGDETTNLTTGTAKLTVRCPFAATLTAVRASLTTASSSGIPTFDINKNGTSVLSTKLTIDANEKTSVTAATPAVISDSSFASDDEITFDIDVAGTNATGAKITLYFTYV